MDALQGAEIGLQGWYKRAKHQRGGVSLVSIQVGGYPCLVLNLPWSVQARRQNGREEG